MILTNHEERHCEVFSSRGLHSSQNCAHNCTANAHKCNHHDEPADADCLTDGDAAAGLEVSPSLVRAAGLLLLQVGVVVSRAAARVVSLAGPENKNNFNSRKLSVVVRWWPGLDQVGHGLCRQLMNWTSRPTLRSTQPASCATFTALWLLRKNAGRDFIVKR